MRNAEAVVELPSVGLRGDYRLIRRKSDSKLVVQDTGWMTNLITDAGMNRLRVGDAVYSCFVGSGNAAPSASDVALEAPVAATNLKAATQSINTSDRYLESTHTYSFLGGSAAGNLTEVGVGAVSGNALDTTLFSRALIVDEFGSPTTITVLEDEDLVVVYSLRMYQPTGDFTGSVGGRTFTIRAAYVNSVSSTANGWSMLSQATGQTNFVSRMGSAGSSNSVTQFFRAAVYSEGSLNAITTGPSGNSIAVSGGVIPSVVAGPTNSYYVTTTGTIPTAFGNGTGIDTFLIKCSPGIWQMHVSPGFNKSSDQTVRVGFRTYWARI